MFKSFSSTESRKRFGKRVPARCGALSGISLQLATQSQQFYTFKRIVFVVVIGSLGLLAYSQFLKQLNEEAQIKVNIPVRLD